MALVVGTNCGLVTERPTSDPSGESTITCDARSWAIKVMIPAGSTRITEIGWWCNTNSEEVNFEVGLYDHNGATNLPKDRLYVAATNAKGTTAGWKYATVDWSVTAETVYWLAVQLDNTATTTTTDRDTTTHTEIFSYDATDRGSLQAAWLGAAAVEQDIAIYGVLEELIVDNRIMTTVRGCW